MMGSVKMASDVYRSLHSHYKSERWLCAAAHKQSSSIRTLQQIRDDVQDVMKANFHAQLPSFGVLYLSIINFLRKSANRIQRGHGAPNDGGLLQNIAALKLLQCLGDCCCDHLPKQATVGIEPTFRVTPRHGASPLRAAQGLVQRINKRVCSFECSF